MVKVLFTSLGSAGAINKNPTEHLIRLDEFYAAFISKFCLCVQTGALEGAV